MSWLILDYKNRNNAYNSSINVRVHKEFKALLKATAKKDNITMSDLIREAIKDYLKGKV